MKPIRISHDFYKIMPEDLKQQHEMFFFADRKFWQGCKAISFPRYGRMTTWDFHIDRDYVSSPPLTQTSNKSFKEVTDQRAIEIKQDMQKYNREIAVAWSGGIDSTVIITALVKHFSSEELKNVVVFANNESYFENPSFYHNVIEKYGLRTVNFKNFSNQAVQSMFDTYLVVDGEPADKLWMVSLALLFETMYGSGMLEKSLKSVEDKFIKFLFQYMSEQQAHDYYDFLIQNINDAGVEVNTAGDLFWWINYNFHWIEHLLIWYYQFPNKSLQAYNQYKKYYKPWYNTDDYQLWSLSTRPKSLPVDRLDLYKMPAKEYINELNPNMFYLNYKSKLLSAKDFTMAPSDAVIMSDGSTFDCKDPELMSKFINRYCLI